RRRGDPTAAADPAVGLGYPRGGGLRRCAVCDPGPSAPGVEAGPVAGLRRPQAGAHRCVHPMRDRDRPAVLETADDRALRRGQQWQPGVGHGSAPRRRGCLVVPIGTRFLRVTRILAPLAMLVGVVVLMTSPAAGAMSLTAPGEALEAAPRQALTQATGVQPADRDPDVPAYEVPTPACASVDGGEDPIKCLPIIRWGTAMQMSDTVAFNVTQPLRSIEVSVVEKNSYETLLSLGNTVWTLAALIVNAVTNYQVNAQMVKPLNDFAAAFGSSIVDSGAIYLILGIAVVAMAAAGVRAGFTLRRFTMMFVALGLFSAMVMGSMSDRGSG